MHKKSHRNYNGMFLNILYYGIVHLCLLCRNLLLSLLATCGLASSEESIEKTQPGAQSFA